jgi:branched-chain amino acid transport system permease protein
VLKERKYFLIALGILVLLAGLVFVNSTPGQDWLALKGVVLRQAFVSGILTGGVLSLVAMGLTLIFGVLDIINFAHGALMTVGMFITFILFDSYGIDPYASIFITVPLLFILGLLVQKFIIYPARNAPAHNQLLLTLGLALFIENILLIIFTGTPRSIRLDYGRGETAIGPFMFDFPLRWFGTVITMNRLAAFLFALLLAIALYLLLQRTDLGKAIRATAQDTEGAALSGINVDQIRMITFGLGTACVGAAASLVLPFLFVNPIAGNTFNITAFIIVVLGGMGSIPGALLGGLIIGLTQELSVVFLPSSTKLLMVFFVFVLVLLFKPKGLFGGTS